MVAFNEQYVTDKAGKPVGVILSLDDFNRIVEDLEELDALRAYDTAKASNEKPVAFEKAMDELERRGRE